MSSRGPGLGSLALRKNGRGETVYVARWSDASGRARRRTLSGDQRAAERILAKIIRERDLEIYGLGVEENQTKPIAWIVETYLIDIRAYRRPRYVASLEHSLRVMQQSIGPIRIRDLTLDRIHLHRRKRLAAGLSVRSVNIETLALKTALKWAVGAGLIVANPIRDLKPLPTNEANRTIRRRALTGDEIRRFLDALRTIDQRRAEGRRSAVPQAPMWKTLLTLGTRWGETVSLHWSDVDVAQETITVRAEEAKSKRHRVIPVPPELIRELTALRRLQFVATGHLPGQRDPVFLTVTGRPWKREANNPARAMLRRALRLARIEERDAAGRQVDVHALRMTAITAMLRRGVPAVAVARVAGHRDIRVTMAHYEDLSIEDLRAQVFLGGLTECRLGHDQQLAKNQGGRPGSPSKAR